MPETVNVGIIGAGRIGTLHARNLAYHIPQANILAIFDVRYAAAEQVAKELNVPMAMADYRVIMASPDIDAVVICSSTDTHSQMIIDAARAGKHIFCEKPIDLALTRIDEALAAVDHAGVKFQVGFNRRFDPNFRRVWELIRNGKIGEPHIIKITSRDPKPPPIEYVKFCGGFFLDMSIHDFDMARYLIGSEIVEIYTLADVKIDRAVCELGDLDTALSMLRFENGVLGTIDNSRKAVFGYDQRVEVFGSEGMLEVFNNRPNSVRMSTAAAVEEDLPLFFFAERYNESYILEMKEFIRCVVEDEQPSVGGKDGRMAVVIGMAARRSYDEHRPVKLEEIG